jgi:hypothetical protein
MSFIAYLCWLLGISAPSDCDANSYEAWLTGACATVEEGNVDATKEQGQQNDAPRHSRGTNISVSI